MTNDQRIEAALERALDLGEVGVQVAAWRGEELVVDTWAGVADEATGRRVTGDTLFPVFSVSKAFVATAVHLQAERGLLDLDDPIAAYWPEYAAGGKGDITLRHVLQHRAGVPQMPPDLTPEGLGDWEAIVRWLAGAVPLASPGQQSIYHSISFGYLLGEVVRRTDPSRRPWSRFVREDLCEPIGVTDVYFGLPGDRVPRLATLTRGAPPYAPQVQTTPLRLAMMPPGITPSPEIWNRPECRAAVVPAAGGVMTARSGARFMAMLANRGALAGRRLLSEERLLAETAPRPHPEEIDAGIGMPTTNGTGGYCVAGHHPVHDPVYGRAAHLLGHSGAGGSYGWADLDTRVGVMITHNRMFGSLPPERHPFVGVADAIRAVVAEG